MKLLLDTNIILDFALQREHHYLNSIKVFMSLKSGSSVGSVTASTITDIYYIIKKSKSHDIAIAFIKDLVSFTEVLGVDQNTIKSALEKDFVDFEDGVQIISAENHNIDVIITRNEKDFTKTSIAVHSPTEFLKLQNDF